jgi:hypothetical protein
MKQIGSLAMMLGVLLGAACASGGAVENGAADAPPAAATNTELPPETIQATVRASFGGLRACYEAGLARRPDLAGTVVMDFKISADGSPSGATVAAESTLRDEAVETCLVDRFSALEFPAGEGVTTVKYPVVFDPK